MSITKAPIPRARNYPAPPRGLKERDPEVYKYLDTLRQQLANDHTILAQYVIQQSQQGLTANLPPAGSQGRFYWATDTLILYYDTGALWHHVQFSF